MVTAELLLARKKLTQTCFVCNKPHYFRNCGRVFKRPDLVETLEGYKKKLEQRKWIKRNVFKYNSLEKLKEMRIYEFITLNGS